MADNAAAAAAPKQRHPGKPAEVVAAERTFFFGVLNVLFSVWIVSVQPWNYFLYHTAKNIAYLALRYVTFKKRKLQWFLSEFCYVVNYLTFLYVFVCLAKAYIPALHFLKPLLDPLGPALFRVGFAWSFGPVAVSVAFFRNALVFHSFDHMTILAVHIGPPLVCYGLRFYHAQLEAQWPDVFHLGLDIDESPSWEATLQGLLINPVLGYAVWLGLYALVHFVFMADTFKSTGMVTMVSDLPQLTALPEGKRPLVYCAAHR